MRKLLFISLACLPWLVAEAEPPADPGKPPAPLSLIVELTDGSRFIGTSELDKLPFIAKYGRMKLVMKEVAAVTLGDDGETGKVTMRNGDNLQGVLDIGDLKLRTLMGEIAIPIRHVVRITAGDGWLPPDLFGPPGKFFEVPLGAKDQHGNPIRRGRDAKTGRPFEIRHKRTGMHLVFIPAGEFMMGSRENPPDAGRESPPHRVRISKPFYLGKYEVTQAEWTSLMDRNPSAHRGARVPIGGVCWNDCQGFVEALNRSLPLSLGGVRGEEPPAFSLPTEAQWEHACRAGTRTRYCFGDNERQVEQYGWSRENSGDRPHPVGMKRPNSWGLYDVHGNIFEYCSDWCGLFTARDEVDPSGPVNGSTRVIRGGSYDYSALYLRSSTRGSRGPSSGVQQTGFRVALTIPVRHVPSPLR